MKWDQAILAALSPDRSLRLREVVEAVLGPPPNPNWVTVYNVVMTAARRGIIRREAGLYSLKELQ